MSDARLTEADFVENFESIGPHEMARRFGISPQAIFRRRVKLEKKLNRKIVAPNDPVRNHIFVQSPDERIHLEVKNGVVLVGSDGHHWPGDDTPAFRAFIKFAREERPIAIIYNGDAFDGGEISRFPPSRLGRRPTVKEELEACQEALGKIEKAKPVKARLLFTRGNHDERFEKRLLSNAKEFVGVPGFALVDHFPHWEHCISVWINKSVVVKHIPGKGGIHSTHNNTLWAGLSTVCGHQHGANVRGFDDYRGTRWGVDNGCLADPYATQFAYANDNPRNQRSGFCVLTFVDGHLLQPELVLAWDENTVQFRGELIRV